MIDDTRLLKNFIFNLLYFISSKNFIFIIFY